MKLNLRASLILMIYTLALTSGVNLIAQEISELDEAFLLFLANGVEVEGKWQDPMSITESIGDISGLSASLNDEIAWITEQDSEQLQELSSPESNENIDGEEDE